MMTARIAGSILTPVLLSLVMTCWNYVPVEMRREDTYYSSFMTLFAGGLTMLLPLFLFILFPLSLFMEFSLLKGRGSLIRQASVYGGAGAVLALLFWIIRGDTASLIVPVRLIVISVLVSWMYLCICRLCSRMFRSKKHKVIY